MHVILFAFSSSASVLITSRRHHVHTPYRFWYLIYWRFRCFNLFAAYVETCVRHNVVSSKQVCTRETIIYSWEQRRRHPSEISSVSFKLNAKSYSLLILSHRSTSRVRRGNFSFFRSLLDRGLGLVQRNFNNFLNCTRSFIVSPDAININDTSLARTKIWYIFNFYCARLHTYAENMSSFFTVPSRFVVYCRKTNASVYKKEMEIKGHRREEEKAKSKLKRRTGSIFSIHSICAVNSPVGRAADNIFPIFNLSLVNSFRIYDDSWPHFSAPSPPHHPSFFVSISTTKIRSKNPNGRSEHTPNSVLQFYF